jgi:hypothetical protein
MSDGGKAMFSLDHLFSLLCPARASSFFIVEPPKKQFHNMCTENAFSNCLGKVEVETTSSKYSGFAKIIN